MPICLLHSLIRMVHLRDFLAGEMYFFLTKQYFTLAVGTPPHPFFGMIKEK